MSDRGRLPPPYLHLPLSGPSMVHPDAYGSAICPPPGGFPPYGMLNPAQVLEQKLSDQYFEIEKLATENRRLAATHETLRQDLSAAKQEFHLVSAYIEDVKSDQEQHKRSILEKMSIMEAEIEGAEPVKIELQQVRAEAQNLVAARQELIYKIQQLTGDLQIVHSEAQQIPLLLSDLDGLRQEYRHCRAAYNYEKKLYDEHLESLQVMEKNFMAMSREVEKLRAELMNSAFDPRKEGPIDGSAGYHKHASLGNYSSSQNACDIVKHGQPLLVGGGSWEASSSPGMVSRIPPAGALTGPGPAVPDASRGSGYIASDGTGYDPYRGQIRPGVDSQKGESGAGNDAQEIPTGPNYDVQRGPTTQSYSPNKVVGSLPAFDSQRGVRSDTQRGSSYEVQRAPGYDAERGPVYEMQRGSGNDVQRVVNNDIKNGSGYHPLPRGTTGPQGQASANNASYVSSTPNPRSGSRYDLVP